MDDDARALWLARHILPHEFAIRKAIRKWHLPDGLEVEDIIQESYAKIAGLPSVAHILTPRAYFIQIARSIVLIHARRAKLVSIEVLADMEQSRISDDAPSPEIHVSDREQLRLLARAVEQMEEPHRTVFTLRMIHDLSHRAIGQKLGLSENAVQKMLARTLNTLAHKIGRGGNRGARASVDSDSKRDQQS